MVLKIVFLLFMFCFLIMLFFVTMDNAQVNTNSGGVKVDVWLLLARAVVHWTVLLGCLGVGEASHTYSE
jgi:hypothetical protein